MDRMLSLSDDDGVVVVVMTVVVTGCKMKMMIEIFGKLVCIYPLFNCKSVLFK